MDLQFSVKEAAAIADVPEPFVRKAIVQKAVRPRRVSAGRAVRHRLSLANVASKHRNLMSGAQV